jgi:hypothetical protein
MSCSPSQSRHMAKTLVAIAQTIEAAYPIEANALRNMARDLSSADD